MRRMERGREKKGKEQSLMVGPVRARGPTHRWWTRAPLLFWQLAPSFRDQDMKEWVF